MHKLKEKIKQIREEYNKNSSMFYGFNERFDEVVEEINAIILYIIEKEDDNNV